MPKVSVIIPVYKAEKYLRRCVDSILNQTFTDWECILVDDGSPDGSGTICDEYVAKDTRIQVIHKENGGVSSARNIGMQMSKSEWITFVDADDFLSFDFLKSFFISSLCSNRLYISGIEYNYPNRGAISMFEYEDNCFNIKEFEKLRRYRILANGCPVSKLFNLGVIRSNNIYFDEDISLNEDHIFVVRYLRCIDSIQLVKGTPYKYWFDQFEISLTKTTHHPSDSLLAAYEINKSLLSFVNSLGCAYYDVLCKKDYDIFGAIQIERAALSSVRYSDCFCILKECSCLVEGLLIDKKKFSLRNRLLLSLLVNGNFYFCLLIIYIWNLKITIRRKLSLIYIKLTNIVR